MSNGNAPAGPLDQFLTPEAMLTPGVAGAMAMMITNALGANFNMSLSWTALILSFVFGLLSIVTNKPIYTKLLFYVLNSLVIFCVASGANHIGLKTQTASLGIAAYAQSTVPLNELDACAVIYSKIASKLGEIDNARSSGQPNDVVQKLYGDYNDLIAQGKAITGCGAVGGGNSVINNPSQITGGPNSLTNKTPAINNRSGFFKQW